MHYYQPGWTLVGGGIKSVDFTTKPMKDVLPKNADWIQSKVVSFDPDNSKLSTDGGDEISYEYLVIAMGLQLRYEDVSLTKILHKHQNLFISIGQRFDRCLRNTRSLLKLSRGFMLENLPMRSRFQGRQRYFYFSQHAYKMRWSSPENHVHYGLQFETNGQTWQSQCDLP